MAKITAIWSKPKKSHSIFNRMASFLIRKYQGTEYSHICIKYFSEDFKTDVIIEANAKGVYPIPMARWLEKHEVVAYKDAELNDRESRRLMAIAGSMIGVEYAFITLFFYPVLELIHALTGKIGWKFAVDGDKSLHCAEFFYLVFKRELGTFNKPQELITSEDIYNRLFQ